MDKQKLKLQNVKCVGCSKKIEKTLNDMTGIDDARFDLDSFEVSFKYKSSKALEKAIKKLKKLGYPLVGNTNTVLDKGTSFLSCALGRMLT